jgi:hypothetical protein
MMNGLYQRALQIYRQKNNLRLVSKGEDDGTMDEIPAEERENILREIDVILARNRVGTEAPLAAGGRSGLGLPFLVNIIILAAVGVAILLFTKSLNGEELQLASGARAIQGAESQVVEALRQESAAQIGQKDQEIVAFQKRLDEATAERERMRTQTAEAVQKREKELSAEMAAALQSERRRLEASGLKTDKMDEELRRYEDRLKLETARQAEAFQKRAQEEAARSEAAVNGLIAEYQSNLSQVQADRSKLQQRYQSREAELRSQYAKDTKALQEEKSQALSDLNRMQELQRQENLVMGRILSSYDEVNRQIRAGDNAAALKSLAALRESWDREPARSLAMVQNRRPVEFFIIGSLEELIRNRVERDSGSAAALVETRTRIAALRDKAFQADRKYLEKDFAASRRLYLSAFDEIPEVRAGYDRMDAMGSQERAAQLEAHRRSWLGLASRGSSAFQTGDWEATLERYRQALGFLIEDQGAASNLVAQVAEAGYRLGAEKDAAKEAARRAILPDRIAGMRKELLDRPAEDLPARGPEFASLLRAKLLLWQIVGSEPIKTRYPELYDTLQRYFATFASQQRQQGRDEALRDLVALTEAIKKGEPLAAPDQASEREARARLLEALEGLLRE